MISDEIAYRHYLDGDESSAAVLVERYGDSLTFYINGYVHDAYEAEDLMIEAFSRIFAKSRPISDGDGMFKAYLYKTARNLALRHIKRRKINISYDDGLSFEVCDNNEVHTPIFKDERDRMLKDSMAKLKGDYREALYLVYFEEMSYRDAAHVMHKTDAQITKLVHRGKLSLRAILEKEGFSGAYE